MYPDCVRLNMAFFSSIKNHSPGRRRLLKVGFWGATGLALYSGEIARHWVEVVERDLSLAGLPQGFDGMRIVQLSDIHLDGYTEPYFLRQVVQQVNGLKPDVVVLTGDYVTGGVGTVRYQLGAAWQCANILAELACKERYAVLGNHDYSISAEVVATAFRDNGIPMLRNMHMPLERGGGRIWMAGVDDPVLGSPDPERAIPAKIRNVPNEPVILLCHAPDYADTVREQAVGSSVGLMLCGHTHGGQVRLPLLGALELPVLGKKYVEGLFQLGAMQLYVNRGIGTIGLPFRLNCPPEITVLTLRAGCSKGSTAQSGD